MMGRFEELRKIKTGYSKNLMHLLKYRFSSNDAYIHTGGKYVFAYIGSVAPLPIILDQQGIHDENKI